MQLGVQVEGREPTLGPTADAMTRAPQGTRRRARLGVADESVVGAAGMHAVFLLAQRDTGLARVALHRMMEAGPDESLAADVATLEDHVPARPAGAQADLRHAVQARCERQRRAERRWKTPRMPICVARGAGLPPFKLGLCLAKQAK